MRFDWVERALSAYFRVHIRFVLRHPVPFILVPLSATALLGIGLLRLPEAMVKDTLELYTPTNARAYAELDQLDTLFHINDTDPFYASRRYDVKRTGYIIVTGANGEHDEDILNPSILKAAAHLWSLIQSFTIDNDDQQLENRTRIGHQQGHDYNDKQSSATTPPLLDYSSLCVRFPFPESLDRLISAAMLAMQNTTEEQVQAQQQKLCMSNPFLELFKQLSQLDEDEQQQSSLMLPRDSALGDIRNVSLDAASALLNETALSLMDTMLGYGMLGGISRDPGTRRLVGAKALMLPYALRHGTEAEEALAERWELALTRFLAQFHSPLIEANWWTYETLASESARDRSRLGSRLLPCFLAVSAFSVLLCSTGHPVRSRPLLALAGILSVSAAIASGTGLLLFLRFPLTSVTLSMPFIIFSVGVDNVFILLAAWRATSPRASLPDRMACTFGDAGVSITITSLTDLLSFSVGCLTPFPSVQMFCLFSAVCLLFCFIYQLTLFAALMCWSCKREVQYRHCMTLRKLKPSLSPLPGATMRRFDNTPSPSSSSIFAIGPDCRKKVSEPFSPCCPSSSAAIDVNAFRHNLALSRFFHTHYASMLLCRPVQCVIMALFGFYLLISAYGCMHIELGLEPLDLLPENSYGKRALLISEQYFADHNGHLHVWMHSLSKLRLGHRRLWLVLEKEIELYEHTEFTGAADSWLRAFLHFQHARRLHITGDNFVPRLHQFLSISRYRRYRRDVRFTEDGTKLEASRVLIRLHSVVGPQNQSRAMQLFRLLADSSELPTGVYADFFMFAEQYSALVPSTIQSVAIAGFSVVLVSLLLIPEPVSALWVSFTIVSINLGVLGLMPFLGLRLDFISMVTIIMSIGFCVDFSAHLAYSFARATECTQSTRGTRLRVALYAVGTPVCQSAASTVLGVSFLASTDSYIFNSFFKTIVLVIVLGLLHGLVILPVLLTLVQQRVEEKRTDISANRPVTATQISRPLPIARSFIMPNQKIHFYPFMTNCPPSVDGLSSNI